MLLRPIFLILFVAVFSSTSAQSAMALTKDLIEQKGKYFHFQIEISDEFISAVSPRKIISAVSPRIICFKLKSNPGRSRFVYFDFGIH